MIAGQAIRIGASLCLVASIAFAQNPSLGGNANAPVPSIFGPIPELGYSRLVRKLTDANESVRNSAYEELASINRPESWSILAVHLSDAALVLTPSSQLILARALAPYVTVPDIYKQLWRHAQRIADNYDPAEPLQRLALDTCLTAIAHEGSDRSLADLARALATDGVLSESAAVALQSYPPKPAIRLLESSVRRSPALFRLLGHLNDPSVTDSLRKVLFEAPEAQQLAAAEALLALGDSPTLALVRTWSDDPAAPEAFRDLSTLTSANLVQVPWNGYRTAVVTKEQRLWATRILDAVSGANPNTKSMDPKQLLGGKAPEKWAVAAQLATASPRELCPWLDHRDPVVTRAIAWALPFLPKNSALLMAAVTRVEQERSLGSESNFYGVLTRAEVRNQRSSRFLLALAHSKSPFAALGAEGLAERLCPALSAELHRLLQGDSPWLRAAAAKGLGLARVDSASGMLANRYRIEPVVWVRRSIVYALAQRNSKAYRPLLRNAAKFDPDPIVRYFASLTPAETKTWVANSDPLGRSRYIDSVINRTTNHADVEGPLILRAVGPPKNGDSYALITGPTGRTIAVPVSPEGLLLLPGDSRSLEVSQWSASPENQ